MDSNHGNGSAVRMLATDGGVPGLDYLIGDSEKAQARVQALGRDNADEVSTQQIKDALRRMSSISGDLICDLYSELGESVEITHESHELVVFRLNEPEIYDRLFKRIHTEEQTTKDVLIELFNEYGSRFSGAERSAPLLVVYKPPEFKKYEKAIDQRLEYLVHSGLSPSMVLDYWMSEVRNRLRIDWATTRSKDQSTISRNVSKARDLLEDQ